MRTPEELIDRFRAEGLNVTPQRVLVFRLLHGNSGHPTADAVYEAARAEMPTLSLRTVYQTLNDLVAMGEVQLLDLGTGSRRFDPNVDGHHHIVCEQCAKVVDVYLDDVPRLPRGQRHGFTLDATEVVFRGMCSTCAVTT